MITSKKLKIKKLRTVFSFHKSSEVSSWSSSSFGFLLPTTFHRQSTDWVTVIANKKWCKWPITHWVAAAAQWNPLTVCALVVAQEKKAMCLPLMPLKDAHVRLGPSQRLKVLIRKLRTATSVSQAQLFLFLSWWATFKCHITAAEKEEDQRIATSVLPTDYLNLKGKCEKGQSETQYSSGHSLWLSHFGRRAVSSWKEEVPLSPSPSSSVCGQTFFLASITASG